MKNLFKFTLCAFASAALVNCTNDVAETEGGNSFENPVETIDLTINASTGDDESRTYLEPAENNTYKMRWNAQNELSLSLVEVTEDAGNDMSMSDAVEAEFYNIDEHYPTNAVFRAPLPVNNGHESYEYLACYPYDALYKFDPNEGKLCVTMPAEQTVQSINGIYVADPNASLMFAKHRGEVHGNQPFRLKLEFKHIAAYGKMTIKNLSLNQGVRVKSITITAKDENTYLAGPWCYMYQNCDNSCADNERSGQSNSVTVNVERLNLVPDGANNVSEFTVYFAMLPVDMTEFTVTVTGSDNNNYDKVCKREDGSTISFKAGVVKGFGVDFNKGEITSKEQRIYRRVYSNTFKPDSYYSSNGKTDFNNTFGDKKFLLVGKDANGNRYVMPNNQGIGSSSIKPTAKALSEAGFTDDGDDLLHDVDDNADLYSWMLKNEFLMTSYPTFDIYYNGAYWYKNSSGYFYLYSAGGLSNRFNINSDEATNRSSNGYIIYSGGSTLGNYIYPSGNVWNVETNSNNKRYFDIYEDTGEIKDSSVAGGGDDEDEWPVDKDVYQKVTDLSTITSGTLSGQFIITAEYNDFLYTFRNDNTDYETNLEALSMVLNGFKVDGDYIAHDNADDFAFNLSWGSYMVYPNTYYGYKIESKTLSPQLLRPVNPATNRSKLYIATSSMYYWAPTEGTNGIKLNTTGSGGTGYMCFDANSMIWYVVQQADWATSVNFYKYIGKKSKEEYEALIKKQ